MNQTEFLEFAYTKLNFNNSKEQELIQLFEGFKNTKRDITNANFYKKYVNKPLGCKGRISTPSYWQTRGWDNWQDKYSEFQSRGAKAAITKGSYKGRFSKEWFTTKYGTDGDQKYKDHIQMRSDANKKENYVDKYGEDAYQELMFIKGGSLAKFIHVHGEEEGSVKYNEFITKARNTEDTFKKRYGGDWKKKWETYKNKLGITLEKSIDRYGDILGPIKYQQWRDSWYNTKLELGQYIKPEDKEPWELYSFLVDKETAKHVHLLEGIETRSMDFHVDHRYSKYQGFNDTIPPYIIGHLVNLEMLPQSANISKGKKCSITKEELLRLFNNDPVV